MSIVYDLEDRIPVKIDDISFKISPLSYLQKSEIQDLAEKCTQTREMKYMREAAFKAIKYAVKSVSGLNRPNGDKFELELENGVLSDKSTDNLLNIKVVDKLAAVCTSLVNGITGAVYDEYGKPLEGVSFEENSEKKQ